MSVRWVKFNSILCKWALIWSSQVAFCRLSSLHYWWQESSIRINNITESWEPALQVEACKASEVSNTFLLLFNVNNIHYNHGTIWFLSEQKSCRIFVRSSCNKSSSSSDLLSLLLWRSSAPQRCRWMCCQSSGDWQGCQVCEQRYVYMCSLFKWQLCISHSDKDRHSWAIFEWHMMRSFSTAGEAIFLNFSSAGVTVWLLAAQGESVLSYCTVGTSQRKKDVGSSAWVHFNWGNLFMVVNPGWER